MKYTLHYVVILFAALISPTVLGNHCDQDLKPSTRDDFPYQPRDDRCEGIYIKQVSLTRSLLSIQSFTQSFEKYDTNSNKPLIIEWDHLPQVKDIKLKARALKRRLYYQMDSFSWCLTPSPSLRRTILKREKSSGQWSA